MELRSAVKPALVVFFLICWWLVFTSSKSRFPDEGYAKFGEMVSDYNTRPSISGVNYVKADVITTTTMAKLEHVFSYTVSRNELVRYYNQTLAAKGWQKKTHEKHMIFYCKNNIGLTVDISEKVGREVYWWTRSVSGCTSGW